MAAQLRAPGLTRAGLFIGMGIAVAYALSLGLRWAFDVNPTLSGESVLQIALLITPLFFLVGIGCFDSWFKWFVGKPGPNDHADHGAKSWKDYFKVNTDHKVIGIQYICLSFFFMFIGGLMAMLIRAELAQPGRQFMDAQTYNGVFSVHASVLIFLFIIPVFAGIANYVLPLMIGAPDMAFPRLNALSFWMLPTAGVMMMLSFLAPGGAFSRGKAMSGAPIISGRT